jgi:hypothetical protein
MANDRFIISEPMIKTSCLHNKNWFMLLSENRKKIQEIEDFYTVSNVTTVIRAMRKMLILSYTDVVNTDLLIKGWIQVGWQKGHLPLH